MRVLQTARFKKAAKKLHSNQKRDLDETIRSIVANPAIGEVKVSDLAGARVYKFNMVNQLTLLAYTFEDRSITLLALGPHENSYRDLK